MMAPQLGIVTANRLSVEQAAFGAPSMRHALGGWLRRISLTKILKQTVDFQIKETETPLSTMGVIQPFGAQRLSIKPEGERSWRWMLLHAVDDLALNTDDKVFLSGVKYRVMGVTNWSGHGFYEYELVEDFTNG